MLAEFDLGVRYLPQQADETANIGNIAIGFNAALNDSIELITELRYDIPQGEEEHAAALSIGMIATLP